MSHTATGLWAPLPATTRGASTKISSDAKGEKIVYTSGRGVFIRDLRQPSQAIAYHEHVKDATVARISPSGFYCASGDVTGAVRVWDVSNQVLKNETKVIAGRIQDLSWDGESKRIIAVGDGKERFGHAFSFDTGSSVGTIEGHSKVVNAVAIRHQRPFRAATAGDDGTIVFYNGVPFKFAKVIKTHSSFVHSLAYSPSGSHFASAGADRKVFVYDGQSGDTVSELKDGTTAHAGGVFAASYSADGKSLASSSADQTVKLWDAETQALKQTWTLSTGNNLNDQQCGNTFVGDHSIVSLSQSGDLNVFDPRDSKPTVSFGHQRAITAIARHSSSSTVVSGSYDGRVIAWSAEGEAKQVKGSGHTNALVGIVATGSNVITAGMDDSLREIDVAGASFLTSIASTSSLPKGVAAAQDGTAFVATAADVQIVKAGKRQFNLPVNYSATAIAATSDGKQVAVGAEDGKVYVYKSSGTTLDLHQTVTANRATITALAYSTDGSMLAAGESSGKILVFDAASYETKISRWVFHTARINSIAWSPDSTHAASGSLDTNVFVWSVASPMKKVAIKLAHPGGVSSVAWKDDTSLISAGADATIRSWSIEHAG